MHVRYEGREFLLVERPLFAEFAWVERQAGLNAEDMTGTERQAALFLISLRREQIMLTWADIQQMSPRDFEEVKTAPEGDPDGGDASEEGYEAADPQPAGVEAGPVVEAAEAADVEATPSTADETVTGS